MSGRRAKSSSSRPDPFEGDKRSAALTVMLVDDHDVVRGGLKRLLEETGDMQVVAEARSQEEAVAEAVRSKPDVIVMDVRLGVGSGVTATREIRSRIPDARVLMLTSFDNDEALATSIVAGASGFVLKEVRGGDIVRSVRAVARVRHPPRQGSVPERGAADAAAGGVCGGDVPRVGPDQPGPERRGG